jgi:hypothetical protein
VSLLSQNGIGLEVVTAKGAVVHGHRTRASRLRQRVWEPLLGSLRRYGVGGVGFRARVKRGPGGESCGPMGALDAHSVNLFVAPCVVATFGGEARESSP